MSTPAPPAVFALDRTFGYMTLRLEMPDGKAPVEKTIDVFDFYNGLFDAGAQLAKEGRHRDAGLRRVEFMREAGFPDLSAAMATAVLDRLAHEVRELQKKDRWPGFSATPGTSDSPPGRTDPPATPPGSSSGA